MRRENGFGTGLMYVLTVLLAVGLAVLIFFNYQANARQQAEIAAAEELASTTPTPPPTETPEPTPTPSRATETVTLAFSGDIVGQAGLSTDAQTVTETAEADSNDSEDGEDGEDTGDGGDEAARTVTYDYSEELAGVVPSLNGADFSACTLVGTLSADAAAEESYHMDTAMATALAGAGYSLVNVATDHILDRGLDGLITTVNVLENKGIVAAGAHKSQETHSIYMADIHGVQTAFLSYTYGTGGVSVADDPWCVDIFTTDYMSGQTEIDYERLDSDIAAAKNAGADVVVCFVYWWDNTQYYNVPRDNQTQMVDYLFENGVDVVIGGGVKSPQPIECRTVERADGSKANCVVCYSLSNLMSCFNDVYTNLSATARIEISRDTDTGEVWVSGVSYDPLFMLDTDDYGDYTEPGYKYRLLDAYGAVSDYEAGESDISAETYDAVLTGISDLREILGGEYDSANGGVSLEYPY